MAPCQLTTVWIHAFFMSPMLIKIHNPDLHSLIKKPCWKKKNNVQTDLHLVWNRVVSQWRPRVKKKKGKNTAGHRSSLGMKMIFERWDIIFTREKHEEIAHSLERAGLLLRDAGERERDRGGERKRGSRGGSGQKLSVRGSVKRDLLKSW